jgi:hypothetical protein
MGIFRQGDPIETAVYLWSTAHGLVTLHRMNRFGGDTAQFERFYHGAIEHAMEGLRPAGARRPAPPAQRAGGREAILRDES